MCLFCNLETDWKGTVKERRLDEQHYKNLDHSHKKRKDSLETRTVLIEISMLYWNLQSGPKHRGSL